MRAKADGDEVASVPKHRRNGWAGWKCEGHVALRSCLAGIGVEGK